MKFFFRFTILSVLLFSSCTNSYDDLKEENYNLKEENYNLKEENYNLKEENERLESEIYELQSKLDEIQSLAASASSEIEEAEYYLPYNLQWSNLALSIENASSDINDIEIIANY